MLFWRLVLAAAALWTMLGAVPAFLDTASAYERFHGSPAGSPELLAIYRGSWGQSFLFAVGYLVAAFNPVRHALVIGLGVVGKIVYAAGFVGPVLAGEAGSLAFAAVIGDFVFAGLFLAFLIQRKPWRG